MSLKNLADDLFTSESASVYRGKSLTGKIIRTKTGSIFQYDEHFLNSMNVQQRELEKGIAFNLPYSQSKIETQGVNLHPFFAGILPEGLRLYFIILIL